MFRMRGKAKEESQIMDSKPRIDRTVHGRTRKEVCDKVALDFMERPARPGAEGAGCTDSNVRQGAFRRFFNVFGADIKRGDKYAGNADGNPRSRAGAE